MGSRILKREINHRADYLQLEASGADNCSIYIPSKHVCTFCNAASLLNKPEQRGGGGGYSSLKTWARIGGGVEGAAVSVKWQNSRGEWEVVARRQTEGILCGSTHVGLCSKNT